MARTVNSSITEIKRDLRIVLLSPWTPPFFKELERIKQRLRDEGYTGTYSIADLPDQGDTSGSLDRSLKGIHLADLAIFIFFNPSRTKGRTTEVNQGVTIELMSTISHGLKPLDNVLVVIEHGTLHVSSGLLTDLFRKYHTPHEEFHSLNELMKIITSFCYNRALTFLQL